MDLHENSVIIIEVMLFFIISKIEAAIELSSQDNGKIWTIPSTASSASDDDFSMGERAEHRATLELRHPPRNRLGYCTERVPTPIGF